MFFIVEMSSSLDVTSNVETIKKKLEKSAKKKQKKKLCLDNKM